MSIAARRRLVAALPRLLRAAEAPSAGLSASIAEGCTAARAGAPGAGLAQAIRAFRASAAARDSLADVLRNELEYEKQKYQQPEELAGGPPAPFTLTESRGDTLLTLRQMVGAETVEVDVMVNDQPEAEELFEGEDGAVDVDVGVTFTATVTKGSQALVFECKSDGSYLDILHVALEPAAGAPEAEDEDHDSRYGGPVYDELDEALQAKFEGYLAERGVTPDLGAYLLRLVHDKEEREYIYWLERVRAFVRQ